MSGIRFASMVAAAVLPLALADAAHTAERVALVIGNSAYAHAPVLANPRNDAADVGAALARIGFSVTRLENADQAELRRSLRNFALAASASEIALVFYAGHGIEVDKRNFLVPVDAVLASDRQVEYEAVPLELVTNAVEGASGLRLVVLDACRENPFAQSMQRAGASRSIGRGLGRVEPAGGTVVAYAAKEGTTAADGTGRNSPYTTALLRHLEEPGLDVGRMLRKVRDAVLASTGGAQEPVRYGSLPGRDIHLVAPAPSSSDASTAAPPSGGEAVDEGAKVAYEEAKGIHTPAAYALVVERFPGSIYAGLAQAWLDKLGGDPAAGSSSLTPLPFGGGGGPARPEASPEQTEAGLGLTREDRRRIQRALSAGGFRPGVADGLFGRRTRAAIAEWQAARGVRATGYLDADGVKALLASAAEPAPERVSDPSAVVLASGLRLSDWVMLAEERLAAGEYRKLLVEGMGHVREYGAHEPVEAVVERSVAGLLAEVEVRDEAGARSALGTVRRIRGVAGERAELARLEASAHARLGQFPEAVQAYRSWLRLARADHPERREMLAAMRKAERGERGPVEGERFRDCDGCPLMVVVPSGSFMMGSLSGEKGRGGSEGPRHRVTIGEPFAAGVYEVTFDEWEACVSGGGCKGYRPGAGWGRGKRPVIRVSWKDAKAYVEWLSRKTGQGYRLLSESEWEYVARAGTETVYHFGSRISPSQANYGRNEGKTVPVGSYPSNAFGLHDVHGNVWEWVEDCWNGSYRGAPSDGSAWESGECGQRVLRGGSWILEPRSLRSADRSRTVTRGRSADLGFRIARMLTP